MRVCLVSREFSPFWGAGIGTYVSAMARAWEAEAGPKGQRHELHVLTAAHKGLDTNGPRLFPGVRFHAATPLAAPSERESCRFPFQRRALEVFRTLEPLHERVRFDYIEFADYWAEGYFALRGKRRLGKFQGVTLGVRLHTPSVLCRELDQWPAFTDEQATLEHMEVECIRDADVLLSPSESLLGWSREQRAGDEAGGAAPAGDQPAFVVPYPFDVKGFATAAGGMRVRADPDAAPPTQSAGAPEPMEILYFGRLERRKGVEHLVDAGRRVIDSALNVRVRLVGADTDSGPGGKSMLAHLKRQVYAYRPGAFVFEGPRPREALGSLIRHATVCCFPSLWENFPNACLEAMALRGCVLGSDCGGMAEIIEDGVSGVLFQGGNATNLTSTLRRVLVEPELRATVSANAPKRVHALCEPGRVLEATVAAIERARAGPRVADRFDAGRRGAAMQIPVPFVRASDAGRSGLVTRALASVLRGIRGSGE